MKKISKIIIIFTIIMSFSNISFANKNSNIYMNNYKIMDKESEIEIIKGISYISIKDIAKMTVSDVKFDEKEGSATISNDDVELTFFKNSKNLIWNGQNTILNFEPIVKDSDYLVQARVLPTYYGMKINWDGKNKTLFVNSDVDKLNKDNSFISEDVMPHIKEKVGDEFYEKIGFTYAGTEIIKENKYLPNGQYFIFTAYRKAYPDDIVNGFFYYNIFVDELFLYSLNGNNEIPTVSKYNDNGKEEVIKIKKNGLYSSLVANAKFLEKVKSNDKINKYEFLPISKIGNDYKKILDSKKNYYFYKAYVHEKNEDEKLKFYLAQDSDTLEIYMFLKDDDKINVIEL